MAGRSSVSLVFEQFLRDCSGVFRIHINAAAFEGREHNACVAQARLVGRMGLADSIGGLREDFAQNARLGKPLGADIERLVSARRRQWRTGGRAEKMWFSSRLHLRHGGQG